MINWQFNVIDGLDAKSSGNNCDTEFVEYSLFIAMICGYFKIESKYYVIDIMMYKCTVCKYDLATNNYELINN